MELEFRIFCIILFVWYIRYLSYLLFRYGPYGYQSVKLSTLDIHGHFPLVGYSGLFGWVRVGCKCKAHCTKLNSQFFFFYQQKCFENLLNITSLRGFEPQTLLIMWRGVYGVRFMCVSHTHIQ